ncbi:MAG: Ycf66 family protein [Snowella sp.]
MLAYILAIAIALASVVLFFSAFFAPKLHRKDDFLWSGVGLFYGLILWVCAGRFTGGALLGQMAAVVLVLSFAWQTISLRAAIANPEKQAGIKTFSLLDWIGGGLGKKKAKVQPIAKTAVETVTPVETTESLTETPVEPVELVETGIPESVSPEDAIAPNANEEIAEEIPEKTVEPESPVTPEVEAVEPVLTREAIESDGESPLPEKTEATITPPRARTSQPFAKPKKQGFFSKLFGKKPTPPKTETITAALDAIETVEDAGEPKEATNPVAVIETETVQESVITTENLDSEESDISVTEVMTEIETVELSEGVPSSETLAENEIEENWDDDWEEENDSEVSQIITDPSAPTMIEKAIAETSIENISEEENPEEIPSQSETPRSPLDSSDSSVSKTDPN